MDASKAGEAANYYEGSMDACDRRFANNKRMLDRECVLVCFVCGNCAGRRAAAGLVHMCSCARGALETSGA